MGYCPAVVEGEFFKAKTMLYPGWRGTPEYETLRRAGLPPRQKAEWLEFLDEMNALKFKTEASPLLKWFHEQGHEQAREGEPKYAEW